MAKQFYQIAEKPDSRKIAEFLSKDGQLLLRPNSEGRYPVPQPGIVKDREYRDFV